MLKVLLAGGGTAGHLNPALAIAEIIKEKYKDVQFLFVGNPNKIEAKLVPKAGYDFKPLEVEGFQRRISRENVKRNVHAAQCLIRSSARCKEILEEFKPDLAIGTGGYVSGPIIRKAAKMGIKTAVHEQNAFAGVTNKLLSKQADCVMLTVEQAKKYFPDAKKIAVTGLPVRGAFCKISKAQAREKLGIEQGAVCVLSTGGSLGARTINNNVMQLFKWYQDNGKKVYHIHSYGTYKGYSNFIEDCQSKGINIEGNPYLIVKDYINMPSSMAACDMVITRCGAASLAEIEAVGRCSLLIPSPMVAENHQYYNGMVLENAGAGKVIEEKDLTQEIFIKAVRDYIEDPKKMEDHAKKAASLHISNVNERILDALGPLIEG